MEKKLVIDALSGERFETELTDVEIAEHQARQAEMIAEAQARKDAKASAMAKLEALGLTVDEVSAVFGLEAVNE